MRPAREGRENVLSAASLLLTCLASMRPAREGRENVSKARSRPSSERQASMRPAREGRENARKRFAIRIHQPRFNEARP